MSWGRGASVTEVQFGRDQPNGAPRLSPGRSTSTRRVPIRRLAAAPRLSSGSAPRGGGMKPASPAASRRAPRSQVSRRSAARADRSGDQGRLPHDRHVVHPQDVDASGRHGEGDGGGGPPDALPEGRCTAPRGVLPVRRALLAGDVPDEGLP